MWNPFEEITLVLDIMVMRSVVVELASYTKHWWREDSEDTYKIPDHYSLQCISLFRIQCSGFSVQGFRRESFLRDNDLS